jgi:hypothetical protein
LYGERAWFHDARGHVRRMGVSSHSADSTIVISLWQGDTCTGTFRLPAKDGARLVATLAYGMVEAMPSEKPDPGTSPLPLHKQVMRFVRRAFRRTPPVSEGHLRLLK